jgi:hypothetical protein
VNTRLFAKGLKLIINIFARQWLASELRWAFKVGALSRILRDKDVKMYYQTIYHISAIDTNKVFFFSTDHCQEFDGEDDFVPISTTQSREDVIREMKESGYNEIPNPDPMFAA